MKNLISILIIVLFFLGVVFYFIWYNTDDQLMNFIIGFAKIQPLIIIFFLILVWRSVALSNRKLQYKEAFKANSIVYLGMWLVPSRLSEFVKPFYFKRTSNLSLHQGWALVIKERVWDLFGLACTCLVVFFLMIDRLVNDEIKIYTILLFFFASFSLIGLNILPHLTKRISFLKKITETLADTQPKEYFFQAFASFILWILSAIYFCIFYSSSGLPELPIIDLMFIFLISILGLVITITPAGLGSYEAILAATLLSYGINFKDGVALALGFRISWMLFPSLLGVCVLIHEGKQILRIRKGLV
jgi:hypothetical protein